MFVGRVVFAALTVQFHVDGDNSVSLLQANDWLSTSQRSYFWGQDYMGTTEVWLFSAIWRMIAGQHAVIPLWYWSGLGQLFFALGVAWSIPVWSTPTARSGVGRAYSHCFS